MRSARAWVTGLCLTVAGALSAAAAHAECTKDTECKGERICEAGQCVDPVPPPTDTNAVPEATVPEPLPAPAPPPTALAAPPPRRDDLPPPEDAAPSYERRSRGLMITGIVLTSLGTLVLASTLVNGERSRCEYSSGATSCTTRPNYEGWAATGLLLGTGIPMLVIGGQKVPSKDAPRAALSPWISPQSAGLGLRLAL